MKLARRTDTGWVELRVVVDRKMRRFAMGLRASAAQWNQKGQRFTSEMPAHASHNAMLGKVLAIANRIVDELVGEGTWSWETFEKRYRSGGQVPDVATHLRKMAVDLEAADKLGNATAYQYAARVVDRYAMGGVVTFDELTADTLREMETMLRRGKGKAEDGGVSFFMRTLKAGVNNAIKEGYLKPERYPFATQRSHGYEMASLRRKAAPRALSAAEMARVKKVKPREHPEFAFAWLLFMISYYARGMNMVDLALVRKKGTVDGRIRYRRRKTETRTEVVLSVPIRGELAELLKAIVPGRGGYLLPILGPEHVSEQQKRWRIQRVTRRVNRDLKRMAKVLDLGDDITFYVARHTYATTLNRKGVAMRKIQEALGHASYGTTELYLRQFDDPELDATDAEL